MQSFIISFSASRLKGFAFFFLSLSFLDFLEVVGEFWLEKNEGVELLLDEGWTVGNEDCREWVGAGGG